MERSVKFYLLLCNTSWIIMDPGAAAGAENAKGVMYNVDKSTLQIVFRLLST